MKVLHLINSLSPRDGGPAVVARELASRQAVRGHDVTIVAPDEGHGGERLSLPRLHNVDVRLARRWRRGGFGLAPGMWRLLPDVHDVDVVHLHGVFSFAAHAARHLADEGARVVVRTCGMLEHDSLELGRAAVKRLHLAVCERPLIDAAAAVQVTTEQEKRKLLDPAWRAKAHVVPVGVDAPARVPFREPVPGSVLFYSRLHPKKRPEWVLEAVHAGAAREAWFAGGGEGAYVRQLRELAERLGVDERVRFLGHVDKTRAAELLDRAALLVLPSQTENFAAVVAEAWGRGCPTVTTPGVALSEIARETGAGTVCEDDRHAFFAAVRETMADPPPVRTCRDAAARFGWPTVLDQLDRLYEAVQGVNGRAAA